MFNRKLKLGTRTSPLALKQVDEILAFLRGPCPDKAFVRNSVSPGSQHDISKGVKVEIVGIDTYGDKDKITPISDIEGTDFFTREIDEALLKEEIDPSTSSFDKLRTRPERSRRPSLRGNGERSRTIDFAVHSAKDLPDKVPQGLYIAAITESIDPYDALVSKNNLKLKDLPYAAKIGASSSRRKTQLKSYRNDFEIVDIRGNIEKRLKRLDGKNSLDAIIVACCALKRLGLVYRITERIPFEILKPHPLQGRLAVEARENDWELIEFLSKIDSRETVLV